MKAINPAVPRSFPRASIAALRLVRRLVLSGAFVLALLPPSARAAEAGTITGSVSNTATGNLLEGAKLDVPALGLSALTDNTGRFVLASVPAGTHELVASYIGLDAMRSQVTVTAGQRTVRNFDLTSGIYKLQEFKVTGDREGAASAITAQRNAPNVKNVVAMDTFGNLPNRSPGEVAIRLPGVAGNLDAEGNVTSLVIRGMGPGLNATTADNTIMASEGGAGRNFPMSVLTGALFESVELIKGQTPEKSAESMGGTLNLKTRSALSMTEKRRLTYSFAGRLAPSFTDQIPYREEHRFHPLFNVGYSEIFSVLGGERNLGVVVNMFYSENVAGMFQTTRDFQNTATNPAYLFDYGTQDIFNNRKQTSGNVKVEYRLSPNTRLWASGQASSNDEPFENRYLTRAFSANSTGTTGTAGVLPGYTDTITQVRASTGSNIDITNQRYIGWNQQLRNAGAGAEHQFGALQVDYSGNYSSARVLSTRSHDGHLVMRINNIGWRIDRTESDLYPRFIQTEGADFTNPANYRPTTNGLNNRDNGSIQVIRQLQANARYDLPVSIPVFFKGGFHWREQIIANWNKTRRWSYIGTGPLAHEPSVVSMDAIKTGRRLPFWQADTYIKGGIPVTPALWNEDIYYRETTQYTGNNRVREGVTAGYVMAQGRLGRDGILGRTGFLTGVRTEKTENEGFGWVRARIPSSAAQQLADPVGSAQRDYANTRREVGGEYTKSFPSVHLTHEIIPNLKARLSWSTSFGRPNMSNLRPSESVNETARTLTISNPSLLPQVGKNWDATLDYYFEPVGNLSIGWFRKEIRDYIVPNTESGIVPGGANNGFAGDYEGFSIRTSSNAGTAFVQGWEASYQQQFTFLPGLLKGLSFGANYTLLDTHGDFGQTTTLSTGQVPGFIPRTGNVNFAWRYRNFNARVLVNRTGSYISSYAAQGSSRNLYRFERTAVNVGFEYRIRPSATLTLDISNPFSEPQRLYRGFRDRMSTTTQNYVTITVGLAGRF
ncbi:MAG: TonB-dependent receptor [Verrucomicrobia bacterium]|nr:TonB-dependent receptor [Verrucomicrobiota bacterium]